MVAERKRQKREYWKPKKGDARDPFWSNPTPRADQRDGPVKTTRIAQIYKSCQFCTSLIDERFSCCRACYLSFDPTTQSRLRQQWKKPSRFI